MAKVEVYSSMFCPFCHRAKKLLSSKGVEFTEIQVKHKDAVAESMLFRQKAAVADYAFKNPAVQGIWFHTAAANSGAASLAGRRRAW